MSQPPRLLVLDVAYPSDSTPYGDVFVRTRVQSYIRTLGAEVVVVQPGVTGPPTLDGSVRVLPAKDVDAAVAIGREFRPDVVLAHFVERSWMPILHALAAPTVVWVHGFEATAWHRRVFNANDPVRFAAYAARNSRQLVAMRGLVRNPSQLPAIGFVFVSKWLERAVCTDLVSTPSLRAVIPNPVDVDRFTYRVKSADDAWRVLLLRSFRARTYATDLASAAIVRLRDHPSFDRFSFTVIGEGSRWERDTAPLRSLRNVTLRNEFVPNAQIPALHADHGVFLCPTRFDTQGMSMCEAMSSGLVPITSLRAAIPEYVMDDVTGIVTTSVDGIVDALIALASDPATYLRMSAAAADAMRVKCHPSRVCELEASFIERVRQAASGPAS